MNISSLTSFYTNGQGFWKFTWTTQSIADTIGGPNLSCVQQSSGAYSKENTKIPSRYVLWSNCP